MIVVAMVAVPLMAGASVTLVNPLWISSMSACALVPFWTTGVFPSLLVITGESVGFFSDSGSLEMPSGSLYAGGWCCIGNTGLSTSAGLSSVPILW